MSWWKRSSKKKEEPSTNHPLHAVHLDIAGWKEEPCDEDMRLWRNPHGDAMTLAIVGSLMRFPRLADTPGWQKYARRLAEEREGGLVEVNVRPGDIGTGTVALIYKRLNKPAYVFTGMLIVPKGDASQIWTVVAGECGTTGVREAIITDSFFKSGRTIEDYESSWAQDPYDPSYRGVDRSLLRFASDDERYDGRFPDHPLTRIRQTLVALREALGIASRVM